ncbi:MAG: hypothetical protein ACRER1_03855 [Gammaproteobacteria bacterium]
MHWQFHLRGIVLAGIVGMGLALGASSAMAGSSAVTYSPPDLTDMSAAQLKKYYAWRDRMDWLLAPIHSRAELDAYLKATAKSGSPLDALTPDARRRFLASLGFGLHGLGAFSFSELQYLSTAQIYKILSLFGAQHYALTITGGRIQPNSEIKLHSSRLSPIRRRFDKYWNLIQGQDAGFGEKRSLLAQSEYDELFAPEQNAANLAKMSSSGLRLLLRAASLTASYTYEARYSRDMALDMAEMEKRHIASEPDYRDMYEALVNNRMFPAARKFYKAHPSVASTPLPEYRDEAGNVGKGTPTVLIVSTAKREMIRQPVNLNAPSQVVILTDPLCHFCAYFLQAIQSRPKLTNALNKHSIWITPPDGVLHFDTLQRWDRAHSAQRINIMYRLRDWPFIKAIAEPTFYFLKRGKLVTAFAGWPKNGNFEKLDAALKKIGLLK